LRSTDMPDFGLYSFSTGRMIEGFDQLFGDDQITWPGRVANEKKAAHLKIRLVSKIYG